MRVEVASEENIKFIYNIECSLFSAGEKGKECAESALICPGSSGGEFIVGIMRGIQF